MKGRAFLTGLLLVFAAEFAALILFAFQDTEVTQDAVLVNEVIQSVQMNWNRTEDYKNQTGLDYVVIDRDGAVLYKSRSGLSESVNKAIKHRDTILNVQVDGDVAGKVIIYNNSGQAFRAKRQRTIIVFIAAIFIQGIACAGYMIYLNRRVMAPFQRMKDFAERIAGGNLDIPLEMDRQNLFGAFTESFDIMRAELKKARMAEAKANESKKELVAKLSHDVKTPVASIKAASEVGAALADDERIRDNYTQIIHKADQINTLITNLFTAALEEMERLSVTPEDMAGGGVKSMLEDADYLHRASIPDIPDCMLYADKLRLQQVFDNIFANAYKYADTQIAVSVKLLENYLAVSIEDYGGGVSAGDLPLIKEKFRRGENAGKKEGAGLGLYISEYFMKEMNGELDVQNGKSGLQVTVVILLSGSR